MGEQRHDTAKGFRACDCWRRSLQRKVLLKVMHMASSVRKPENCSAPLPSTKDTLPYSRAGISFSSIKCVILTNLFEEDWRRSKLGSETQYGGHSS